MPAWGVHLYTAKKISEKFKIEDYNSFLIGNIVTDINNGYVVKDIKKIIEHKKTHYYIKNEINNKKLMYYDIEQFISENSENLNDEMVLGYIVHLLTDEYWNNLTYNKHGLYNAKNESIGIKLNNGVELVIDKEERTKIKQKDFRIFEKYIYKNNLTDTPIYSENFYEKIKKIKQIELTKEDIKRTIEFLDKDKRGLSLEMNDYKIFTQLEMEENVDICVDYIINYLKEHNINLEKMYSIKS